MQRRRRARRAACTHNAPLSASQPVWYASVMSLLSPESARLARCMVALAAALAWAGACSTPEGPPKWSPLARLPSPKTKPDDPPPAAPPPTYGDGDAAEPIIMAAPARSPAISMTPGSRPGSDATASLNLEDADLAEAAKLILNDVLGAPYSIDPRVRGRVTLSSARPLDRDGLLAALESALSANQAVLVETPEGFRIAPAVDPTGSGVTLRDPALPGYGVTVMPLRGMEAEAARQLLDGALARPGLIRADAARNLLFISGPAPERRAVVQAAKELEASGFGGRPAGLFTLRSANAPDAAAELLVALEADPGGPLEGAVRVTPIVRLNALLITAARPDLLDRAKLWIETLDREASSGETLRTYFVEALKAVDLAAILNEVIGGPSAYDATSSVAPDLRAATVRGPEAAPSGPAASLRTRRPPSASSSSPSLKSTSGGVAARIVADPINNALIVVSDAAGHSFVAKAIAELDRPPLQVMIDAIIAEVTLSDDLRFGVQFFFETAGIRGIADRGRGGFSAGDSFDSNGVFPGFNLLFQNGEQSRLALDALSAVTDVKIVSNPSILALDNQPAELNVGDKVPVVTRQSQSVIDPDSPIINQVEFQDTGVILRVTPRIGASGLVTMEVAQEVSNVRATAQDSVTLTPTISQRKISTSVAVPSGQTIVLGGLIDDSRQKARTGIPVLSRLPGVGPLFGTTDKEVRRTELLVFLTPRVIRDQASAAAAAEEIQGRMEALAQAVRAATAEHRQEPWFKLKEKPEGSQPDAGSQ